MRPSGSFWVIAALVLGSGSLIGCGDGGPGTTTAATTAKPAVHRSFESVVRERYGTLRSPPAAADRLPAPVARLFGLPKSARAESRLAWGKAHPLWIVPAADKLCLIGIAADGAGEGGCSTDLQELVWGRARFARDCALVRGKRWFSVSGLMPDNASDVDVVLRDGTRVPMNVTRNAYRYEVPRDQLDRLPTKIVWRAGDGKIHSQAVPLNLPSMRIPCPVRPS